MEKTGEFIESRHSVNTEIEEVTASNTYVNDMEETNPTTEKVSESVTTWQPADTEKVTESVTTWQPADTETIEVTTSSQILEMDTTEPVTTRQNLGTETTESAVFQVLSNGKFNINTNTLGKGDTSETLLQTTWPPIKSNSQEGHAQKSTENYNFNLEMTELDTVPAEPVTSLSPEVPVLSITEFHTYSPDSVTVRPSKILDTTELDVQIFNDDEVSDLLYSPTELYQTTDITETPVPSFVLSLPKSQVASPLGPQASSLSKQISGATNHLQDATGHDAYQKHDEPKFSPWYATPVPLREARIPLRPAIIYSIVDGNFYRFRG